VINAAVLAGFVVAATAAYFAMPVGALQLTNMWEALGLVLLALTLLGGLYVRGLLRLRTRRHPLWRAAALVVVLVVTVVLGFAYGYLALQARSPGELSGLSTHMDALYFTVTMIATVGFGDIAPTGQVARAVATTQMIANLVILGFVVRTALDVGRREQERRGQNSTAVGGQGPPE
jgi:voltage-gated potassium channel